KPPPWKPPPWKPPPPPWKPPPPPWKPPPPPWKPPPPPWPPPPPAYAATDRTIAQASTAAHAVNFDLSVNMDVVMAPPPTQPRCLIGSPPQPVISIQQETNCSSSAADAFLPCRRRRRRLAKSG